MIARSAARKLRSSAVGRPCCPGVGGGGAFVGAGGGALVLGGAGVGAGVDVVHVGPEEGPGGRMMGVVGAEGGVLAGVGCTGTMRSCIARAGARSQVCIAAVAGAVAALASRSRIAGAGGGARVAQSRWTGRSVDRSRRILPGARAIRRASTARVLALARREPEPGQRVPRRAIGLPCWVLAVSRAMTWRQGGTPSSGQQRL